MFEFLDYRAYLRAFYEAEKAASPTFSHRAFSLRAGVKAPNHLMRIMDGTRSLRDDMVERYAKALRLNSSESEYFRHLVRFTDAKSSKDRELSYQRIRSFHQYRQAHQLDDRQAEYFEHWYIPAIRELIARPDFRSDPAWIAKQLRPAITVAQAKKAVETLLALGLVQQSGKKLLRLDRVVSTGPQTLGTHMVRYHRGMLERASAAIDEFRANERDLTSVTCCVDARAVEELREMIAELRRRCVARTESSPNPQVVVQLNIQLFPLSTTMGA